ncbi:DUF1127 domain-containing protein [Ancylobacter defluvii]|uniref:YjiS-like domain-containing protein n=1 Tax=Ancylobacter defluvii TaxID=1282440 RepID=A0A9W6N9J2_9HYPH|nr:DUF1127 domain-containing protein [Ancylobacter defluvii]MBS7587672.1 DUF1127 domain-containing protein [Ancylobacter defluvii]GLK82481.1 hypothetical protein GCM10017653_05500 [Ancylobacter defluvii]
MQIDQISVALRTAFARRRQYRQVQSELEAYSDRELGELGFSRADIHDIARQAAESVPQAALQRRLRLVTAI